MNRAEINRIAKNHGGIITEFRNLPKEAKFAMIHYMAIDGEAWELSKQLAEAPKSGLIRALKTAGSLKFYDDKYGDQKFGYIAELPMSILVSSIERREVKNNGFEFSQSSHKHRATSKTQWPVILSGFQDETIQDGWTRFYRYHERRMETCPALYYLPNKKRQRASSEDWYDRWRKTIKSL